MCFVRVSGNMGRGERERSGEITGQFREISLHDPTPGHLGIPVIASISI